MEYGFLKSLEALHKFYKDDLILCWEGKRNFRYKIDPEYKISRRKGREKDAHKYLTMSRVDDFKNLLSMVAKNAYDVELEGDDVIASLAEKYCKTEKVIIYSNDKDLLQLVRGKPHPVHQIKKFRFRRNPWTAWRIAESYHGLRPNQLPVYFAFVGDKFDDIPGAQIRSSLVAAAIIDGLPPENLFEFELFSGGEVIKLEEHLSSGRFQMNLDLVTLRVKDVEIKEKNWNRTKIGNWLEEMDISSLGLCKECGISGKVREEDEF